MLMEFQSQTYFQYFVFEDIVNVFGNVTETMVYEIFEEHVLISKTKVSSSIMKSSIDTLLHSLILFKLYDIIPNGNDYLDFNQSGNIAISNSNDANTGIRIRILLSDMMNDVLSIDIALREYATNENNNTLIIVLIYCYYETFIGNESTDGTSNFKFIINIILLTQLSNVVFTNITKYSNIFAIITIIFTIIIIYWSYIKNETIIPQIKLWLQFPNDKRIQINCCKITMWLLYMLWFKQKKLNSGSPHRSLMSGINTPQQITMNIQSSSMESSVIVNIHRYFYFVLIVAMIPSTIFSYYYPSVAGYYNISGGNGITTNTDEYNIICTRYCSCSHDKCWNYNNLYCMEACPNRHMLLSLNFNTIYGYESINNVYRDGSKSCLNITNFDLYDNVYGNNIQVFCQDNISIMVNNVINLGNQSIYQHTIYNIVTIYLNTQTWLVLVRKFTDIVNLANIQINELQNKYGNYFNTYCDVESKIIVSFDKTIIYKETTTIRRRTIARKRRMTSSNSILSIDYVNDVIITIATEDIDHEVVLLIFFG